MTLRYQVDSGPEDDFLAASTPVVICSYTSGACRHSYASVAPHPENLAHAGIEGS
jgi:hypothetical protein